MAGSVTLSIGVQMPMVGLGLWRMEGKSIRDLILSSIKHGYRRFDCTAKSNNEAEVGEALTEAFQSGLVTLNKGGTFYHHEELWNSDHGHVLEGCKDSLRMLQLKYLDLCLIHFPVATRHTGVGKSSSVLDENGVLDIETSISLETTWRAMEDLVSLGLLRSIRITNIMFASNE